jgi:hypothetical protein
MTTEILTLLRDAEDFASLEPRQCDRSRITRLHSWREVIQTVRPGTVVVLDPLLLPSEDASFAKALASLRVGVVCRLTPGVPAAGSLRHLVRHCAEPAFSYRGVRVSPDLRDLVEAQQVRVAAAVARQASDVLPDPDQFGVIVAAAVIGECRSAHVEDLASACDVSSRTLEGKLKAWHLPSPRSLLDWTTLIHVFCCREHRQPWSRIRQDLGVSENRKFERMADRVLHLDLVDALRQFSATSLIDRFCDILRLAPIP